MGKVIPLFGNEIQEKMKKEKTNSDRMIRMRIERFAKEFLQYDADVDDLELILECIDAYLHMYENHDYLNQSIYHLRESIWWLQSFSDEIE
jgi:hypothetical protein